MGKFRYHGLLLAYSDLDQFAAQLQQLHDAYEASSAWHADCASLQMRRLTQLTLSTNGKKLFTSQYQVC
jgi:hypothetical protein